MDSLTRNWHTTWGQVNRANSKQIDGALLARHFAPVAVDGQGHSTSTIHHSDGQEHYWMIFALQKNGQASDLSLYACRHTLVGVLETLDGHRRFDVPIRQAELMDPFGGPARLGRDFTILGGSCN